MQDSITGRTIGHYKLLESIGKGGMATVYRAQQTNIDRMVAVKIMTADLAAVPDFVIRFKREADTIARLEHPHILPIHDYGEEDGLIYLVTRLMTGGTLTERLAQSPLPLEQTGRIARQLGDALYYAHERGVVHRDLKPSNILLDERGNAYLTDFGIAKLMHGTNITQTGTVMGTPMYMAPEQWRGEPIDGRTDLYALGIILYEMLSGEPPFQSDTTPHLMYAHLEMPPPPLVGKVATLPPGIERVIHRAMAKAHTDRFSTALDMMDAFEQATRQHPVLAVEDTKATTLNDSAALLAYEDEPETQLLVQMPPITPTGAGVQPAASPAQTSAPQTPAPVPLTPPPGISTAATTQTLPAPQLDMRWLIGGGIVIVLALVAVIALLVLNSNRGNSDLTMIQVAMTATALAQNPPDLTATGHAQTIAPTVTETLAQPTATDIVAATAVAMNQAITDTFDSIEFLRWDRNEANRYLLDGRYHMLTLPGEGGSGLSLAQGMPLAENFRLEIEVEDLSETENQVVYAVLFRVQDTSNYYRFTVTNDGQAGVIKRLEGADYSLPFTTIYNWDSDQERHTLGIEMAGPDMVLYVDGQIVLRDTDADIAAPGGIGLTIFREGAHVAWDNLVVEPISRLSDPLGVATAAYSDDFEDNECQWTDVAADETAFLQDGRYHLAVPAQDTGTQVRCANIGLYQNARIMVTVEDLSDGLGAYGLVFRQNSLGDDYYRLVVNSAGQITVQKQLADDPGCQPCLIDLQPLPGFRRDEAHTLAVEAFEGTIRGFVDGVLVIEIEDDSILAPGIVRLGAYQGGTHVAFDDLVIEPIDRLSEIASARGIALPEVAAAIVGRDAAPLALSMPGVVVSRAAGTNTAAASQSLTLPETVQDFVFSARLYIEAESASDQCGLVFRANNPSPFHWLNVSRDGTLAFGNDRRLPSNPLLSERLDGPEVARGDAVEMVIVAQSESIYLALDGEQVEGLRLLDDAPIGGGLFVWVFVSADNDAECHFEDITVWSLDE